MRFLVTDSNAKSRATIAGRSGSAIILFLAVAMGTLVADLLLKSWSFANVAGQPVVITPENVDWPVPHHDGVVIIPSVLHLKLTKNLGAVFGIAQGGWLFFIVITFIALVVIGTVFWRSPRRARIMHIALGLVLGGAIGNLYDRLMFGAVRDMLYLFPGVKLPWGMHWPQFLGGSDELYPWIFNLADAALCVGVILILLSMMRGGESARAEMKREE